MIPERRRTGRLGLLALGLALVWPVVGWAQPPYRDRVDYLIETLLYAHDDDDREDAAEDLGRIGDARAIPALERAASYDPEDDVREEAFKALRRIRGMQPIVVAAPPPAPVTAPAPAPVVEQQPAPVVAAPAPAVVAPPPVVVAPPPVVVPQVVYPAPVVVAPAVPVYAAPRWGFSFGYRSYHSHRYYRCR